MAEFLTTPLLVNNWQKDYKEKKQNNKKGMSFLVKNLNPGSVTYWQFSVWQVTYKSSLWTLAFSPVKHGEYLLLDGCYEE